MAKLFCCEVACLELVNVIYCNVCRSVLWSVIYIMCSGAGFGVSGVGRVSGMSVAGRLCEVMFAV